MAKSTPTAGITWSRTKSGPPGVRVTPKTRNPGATPKVMRSQRESSIAPKLEVVRVIRATKPSRASKIMAIRMSQAACLK